MLYSQEEPLQEVFVHCLFLNKLVDFVHPKNVICDAFDLVLKNHEDIENMKFGWRYSHSLKKLISNDNFLRSSKTLDCKCSEFTEFCKDFGNIDNHVCMVDLNIIKNTKLKKLVGKGLNHILSKPLNPHLAIAALIQCLADIASKLQLEPKTYQETAIAVQKIFLEKINTLPQAWLKIDNKTISQELEIKMSNLMNSFFIVGLDKAPNNASIICKNIAYLAGLERLRGEDFCNMSQNPYEASNMIKKSLIDMHYRPPMNEKLCVLFLTFKIHKNKFRWILDASDCIFLDITKDITKCLNLVLNDFQIICAQKQKTWKTFLGIETNPFWVVKNAIEVLLSLPHNITHLFTADIMKIYR